MSEHTAENDAQITLAYLEGLSARSEGDGRLRDAIALVRSAVWDDLDSVIPPGSGEVTARVRVHISAPEPSCILPHATPVNPL